MATNSTPYHKWERPDLVDAELMQNLLSSLLHVLAAITLDRATCSVVPHWEEIAGQAMINPASSPMQSSRSVLCTRITTESGLAAHLVCFADRVLS